MREVLLVENEERGLKRRGWGVPGGRGRPGEKPEDTIIREYKSETGFVVIPDFRICVRKNIKNHQKIFVFVKIVPGGKKKTSEEGILDCRWWPLDSLPEDIYFSHRQNIFKIKKKKLSRLRRMGRAII